MTDVKIEPCPICESNLITERYDYFSYLGMTPNMLHHVWCNCGYHGQNQRTISLAIAAHNEYCEYVRLGKAAKKLEEVLDIKCAVESADPEAWMDAMVEEIKGKFALADRAKAFCENPPKPEENTEGNEFCDGYEAGEQDGIKKCLDRLTEATSPDMLINGWHDAV